MLRPSIVGALVFGTVLLGGCSTGSLAPKDAAPIPTATPARPQPPAVPTTASTVAPAPLTTSSGFRLDVPNGRPILNQPPVAGTSPDRGLQTIRAPKGTEILSPAGWQAMPAASLSQQLCAEGSCVQVQEDIVVVVAPDGHQSLAVFTVDVPQDLPSGAILDGLVRGVVTGFSTRAPDTRIVEGPGPIDLPGASAASALRAVFTQPATGSGATLFVEAAAQGQHVGGVFVITEDGYLQAHRDEIAQVRSSFRIGTIDN